MSMESKIDKMMIALYGLVPVVDRVEKNIEHIDHKVGALETRLGFIESSWVRIDERVVAIERRGSRHLEPRPRTPWVQNVKDHIELVLALPMALRLMLSLSPFLGALVAFLVNYLRAHHGLGNPQ